MHNMAWYIMNKYVNQKPTSYTLNFFEMIFKYMKKNYNFDVI